MANKLPTLGEDFEIWGHWWIPSDPEDKVAGRLTSKFGSLELKLLHPFQAINPHNQDAVVLVIHGVGGTKLFTLWDGIQIGCTIEAPGTVQPIFRNMRVLVGGHLGRRNETTFDGMVLYGANIGPWLGLQLVEQRCTTVQGSPIIEYRLSERASKEFIVPSIGVRITVGGGFETNIEEFRAYGFKVFPSIHVAFDDSVDFQKIQKLWESVANFLSLTTGTEFVTERFTLEVNGGGENRNTYDLMVDHPLPEETRMLKAWEVLVPLVAFGEETVQIFDQWFSNSTEIRDSIDLLLGNLQRRTLPLHIQLSTLCQALESFHRTTIGGGYITREEFKKINKHMSESIPQEIPSELATAIRDRLRYSYEYSLRTRLSQLVGQFNRDNLEQLGINCDQFVGDVCKARNDFTHWDALAMHDDTELLNLVSRLNLVARIILLRHFGIDENVVVRRALENKHLYFQEWRSIPTDGVDCE